MPETAASIEPWFSLQGAASARGEAAQFDRLLAGAELAVRRGCERVWVEGPPGLALPSDSLRLALSLASQVASLRVVATGIRVESMGSPDASRSWIRLAEDAATADGISGGRLELAFAALPGSLSSAASLDAVVRRLRSAWSGEPIPVGEAGETIEIHPRPCSREGLRLWVRADSEEAAQVAASAELSAIVSKPEFAQAHRDASGGPGAGASEVAWLSESPVNSVAHSERLVAVMLDVPSSEGNDEERSWLASVEEILR